MISSRLGRRVCALVMLAAAIGAEPIAAQSPTGAGASADVIPRYRYRVLGAFDMQTGSPIEGADVIDVLSGNSVKTTSTGTASLLFLPDGGGLVRIRKLGYELQTAMIAISPEDTIPVTMVISRVVDLPTVVTTAKAVPYISPALRGFEDRRLNHSTGYFIPEEELRKEGGRAFAMALKAHIPTVQVTFARASAMLLEKSPQCGAGGPPDVYLDGVPLVHVPPPTPGGMKPANSGIAPIDLSQFQTESLAGVEYYPTTSLAPAQFGATSSACGVLLLWTREK